MEEALDAVTLAVDTVTKTAKAISSPLSTINDILFSIKGQLDRFKSII